MGVHECLKPKSRIWKLRPSRNASVAERSIPCPISDIGPKAGGPARSAIFGGKKTSSIEGKPSPSGRGTARSASVRASEPKRLLILPSPGLFLGCALSRLRFAQPPSPDGRGRRPVIAAQVALGFLCSSPSYDFPRLKENIVQHFLRQLPGLRVLLAGMVRTDHCDAV
jgi:hypothetical protein